MLVPELMVTFPLPLHINLSNNGTNRLFDYGTNVSAGTNGKLLSWPWHPITLYPIVRSRPRVRHLFIVCTPFSVSLYLSCSATDRWAHCLICLPVRLSNMFPFLFPVTICSRPVPLLIRYSSVTRLSHLPYLLSAQHDCAHCSLVIPTSCTSPHLFYLV